jgi:hypothetical protein
MKAKPLGSTTDYTDMLPLLCYISSTRKKKRRREKRTKQNKAYLAIPVFKIGVGNWLHVGNRPLG